MDTRTVVTCQRTPAPRTILAIQTESDPPYVLATYGDWEYSVPTRLYGMSDMLIIRADQALRLFTFVKMGECRGENSGTPCVRERHGDVLYCVAAH